MGFSRQEHWSGLPFPPPGGLPDLRTEPSSLTSPALAGGLFTISTTWEGGGASRLLVRAQLSIWVMTGSLGLLLCQVPGAPGLPSVDSFSSTCVASGHTRLPLLSHLSVRVPAPQCLCSSAPSFASSLRGF